MEQDFFIITNNPMVYNELENSYHVEYKKGSYKDVLITVRDYIYEGHTLLTHPLAGSIKPNETPYRSVAVSLDKQKLDLESVDIISSSIHTCDKFSLMPKEYSDEVLKDFQQIDYSLIYNIIYLR
jgi:hypothetical protein